VDYMNDAINTVIFKFIFKRGGVLIARGHVQIGVI
jgi:hypothetical protein